MSALPPVLVELKANASEFMAALGHAQAQMTKLGTEGASSAAKFSTASKIMFAGIAAGAGVAAVESIKLAAKFQESMEVIHTQAGASQAEVNKLSGAVLKLAGRTATAPDELAAGLYHLESAGLRGATAMNALRVAAEGAKIGHADLEEVTNALNAAIASGIPGVQNLDQAMGALNAIVGSGDMRMQDLAEALGTGVLAGVKQFGLSLNDVGAALATFGDNNIRGADAATQLRTAVMFMAKPAASAKEALAGIGMTTDQLAKDMQSGGLIKAITDLHDHLAAAGDTGSKAGAVLLDAFGKKAGTGIAVLVDQYARLQSKVEEVRKGAANFQSDWDATTKTFAFRMEQARAAAEALGIAVGTVLIGGINKAIDAAASLAHAVQDATGWVEKHQEVVTGLATVLAASLLPAALAAGRALMWVGLNAVAAGILAIMDGSAALITTLRNLSVAALASKVALLGIGFIVANGVADWIRGDAAINKFKDDMAKPVDTSFLADMNKYLGDLQPTISRLNNEGSNFASDMLSWATHPVQTFNDAIGNTANQVNKLTDQLTGQALGNFHDLVTQLHGFAESPVDAQNQTIAVLKAMGVSADDLAHKSFPDLLASVQAWMAANDAAKTPAEQANAAIVAMGSGALSAADDVKALKAALDELAGKALSADEAAIGFRNDLVQMDAALKKSRGSMTLSSQAGRDSRQAFDTAARAALDLASSLKDSGASNDRVRSSLRASIKALQAHAGSTGYAKDAVDTLKAALDKIPGTASKAAGSLKAGAAAAKQAGVDFDSGFANGITAGEAKALRNAYQLGKLSAVALKNAIASASPSKVTAAEGDNFVAGFVNQIEAGTAAAAAAASRLGHAAANALTDVTKAVDPRTGSPPDLIAGYASSRADAIHTGGSADVAAAHYSEIAEHAAELTKRYDTLRAADAAGEAAARKHAVALSNVAHEAFRAAEAMPSHTKAQRAEKKAALESARALEDQARAASQHATALVRADNLREASSRKASDAAKAAADKAKQSYDTIAQAARDAASAAAQAAKDLISSVQSEADQLTQAISGFVSTAQQGITGQIDFSALWGGADGTTASADEFQAGLDTILARAEQFSADLKKLTAAGASESLINGLLGMGPQAGDAAAQQLIVAGQDAISKANDTLAQITAVGGAGAQALAGAFYGQGVDAFDQFLAGLQSKFPELDAALGAIADQVNGALGSGALAAPTVAIASRPGGATLTGPTAASGLPGGAAPIVVNFNGPVYGADSQQLADQVQTALLQKKARSGALGLS